MGTFVVLLSTWQPMRNAQRLITACPLVEKLGKLLADVWDDNEMSLQLVSVKVLTNLSLDTSATWPAAGSKEVRTALDLMIANDGAELDEAAAAEREQLLELSQHLLSRLPLHVEDDECDLEELQESNPGVAASAMATPPPNAAPLPMGHEISEKGDQGAFVCAESGCGRSFSSQAKLDAHMERRHPGQ